MGAPPSPPSPLPRIDLRHLVCPVCHATLEQAGDRILCSGCGRQYPIVDGIPVLLAARAL